VGLAPARDITAGENLACPAPRQPVPDPTTRQKTSRCRSTEDELDPTRRYGDEQPHTSARRSKRDTSVA
jgi:hypothetical protein